MEFRANFSQGVPMHGSEQRLFGHNRCCTVLQCFCQFPLQADHKTGLSKKAKAPWMSYNKDYIDDSELCIRYLSEKFSTFQHIFTQTFDTTMPSPNPRDARCTCRSHLRASRKSLNLQCPEMTDWAGLSSPMASPCDVVERQASRGLCQSVTHFWKGTPNGHHHHFSLTCNFLSHRFIDGKRQTNIKSMPGLTQRTVVVLFSQKSICRSIWVPPNGQTCTPFEWWATNFCTGRLSGLMRCSFFRTPTKMWGFYRWIWSTIVHIQVLELRTICEHANPSVGAGNRISQQSDHRPCEAFPNVPAGPGYGQTLTRGSSNDDGELHQSHQSEVGWVWS